MLTWTRFTSYLTTITFLHKEGRNQILVLAIKRTFPGVHILMREVRMYGSIHKHGKISSHKPFGFFSYTLQIKTGKPLHVTVQFIFYYSMQNFTSLILRKKTTKFRFIILLECKLLYTYFEENPVATICRDRKQTVCCRQTGGGVTAKAKETPGGTDAFAALIVGMLHGICLC